MTDFSLHSLRPTDRDRVTQFIAERWGAPMVVAHGEIFYPHDLPGFVAVEGSEWVGLVTYRIDGARCEIMSIDSLRPAIGIGTALIEAVKAAARQAGCTQLYLITTNDNLHALGFYQRRGFVLVALRPNAIAQSRRLKPQIPLIGDNNIPIRDEIELALPL